ncbi:MAG: type II secretion system protein F [Actinomycetales bacterium]|nr:type II secretion system protein F [Actinomycetales bacterium]
MTPGIILVELMVTLGVMVVALVVILDNRQRDRQLRETGTGSGSRGFLQRWYHRGSFRLQKTRVGRSLQRRLRGAALPWQPIDFVAMVVGVGVLLALITRPVAGNIGAVIVLVACWMVANRWLDNRRQKRLDAFVGQLPEVARVLSNAASAGLALRSAVGLAARELDDPAGTELRTVAGQLNLGRTIDQALTDLSERLPSRELAVLVQTLIIQSRAGGALVSALLNIANTLEQRKDLHREVRTAVAGAVFSSYIVLGIGIGSIFVMNLLSPGALDQMAQTTVGRIIMLIAGLFFAVGFILINRITRIEI